MFRIQRYKIQKGILPLTLLIVGMLTIMYSMVPLFIFFAPSIFLNKLVFPADFNQKMLFYLTAPPLGILGFYLTSIFPWIKVGRQGIKIRGVYINHLVKWSEISNLVEIKNGTILVLVNRKSSPLFNGLLFQRFTGMVLGYKHPAILLSPGLEQRDEVLKEVMTQLVVSKTT